MHGARDAARGVGVRSRTVARLRAAGCVLAEEEADLLLTEAAAGRPLEPMVTDRLGGTPLEHVLGWSRFDGLRVEVDPGVFVPRGRSALLAAEAAAAARPGSVVVDCCCGSGVLGLAVARRVAGVTIHATDVDPTAVRCAHRNLAAVGGVVHRGDLLAPLPPELVGEVDVIVANVPYVPTDEVRFLPVEARVHEARVALDGGRDGLDVQRRVVADAPRWLTGNGVLVTEVAERQVAASLSTFEAGGFDAYVVRDDELDATVVVGRRAR